MLVAVIVGLICGSVRMSDTASSAIDDYEHLFTDVAGFEHALKTQISGQRLFTDIIVYPYRLNRKNREAQRVYLVTGLYWDGVLHASKSGELVADYQTACFIAASPYFPRAVGHSEPTSYPSVLNYLDSLQSAGVHYDYAWWWWLATPLAIWLMGSILVIGIIWPTVINLIAFRSLLRPAEAPGISLAGVSSRNAQPSPVQYSNGRSAEVPEGKQRPEPQEMPHEPVLPAPRPVVATLSNAPDERPSDGGSHPQNPKDFGARQDDFYPTELRTHPHE